MEKCSRYDKHLKFIGFKSSVESQPKFRRQLCLTPVIALVSCSVYSSTLKIEATSSSETSVDFQRTTWRYIPEDRTFRKHCCEKLKAYFWFTGRNTFELSHATQRRTK
jgi:hypothetical protein